MTNNYSINTSKHEYEERRHVFELYRWLNSQLDDIYNLGGDSLYFDYKTSIIKPIIEEALPVAHLGLSLMRPHTNVYVKCNAGNDPYDAEIEIESNNTPHLKFKIEVTTTVDDDSAMRRLALAQNGFAFSGRVQREGDNIVTAPEFVDVDEDADVLFDLAFTRFKAKATKGYGSDTALLVFVGYLYPFPRSITLQRRQKLVQDTAAYVKQHCPDTYAVHYCYAGNYAVDTAWP